jgi:tetratricopeptide (TPR) repeat protein
MYSSKGEYDRAIQDCDQAITLDPNFAPAFYDRGLAKQKKGDKAGGDVDMAKARLLDPRVGH